MQSSTFIPQTSRAIAEDKWYPRERLGGDVGSEVAELDYRLNLEGSEVHEKTHWFLKILERFAESRGMQGLAKVQNAERALLVATRKTT